MTLWSFSQQGWDDTVTSWLRILPGSPPRRTGAEDPSVYETTKTQYQLVVELQSHLQLSRQVLLAQDLSEPCVGNVRIRRVENNIIEEVE